MTEKDEENYRNSNISRFCEKNIDADKVGDHCHLTGFYRGPAHNTCVKTLHRNKIVLYHSYLPF